MSIRQIGGRWYADSEKEGSVRLASGPEIFLATTAPCKCWVCLLVKARREERKEATADAR